MLVILSQLEQEYLLRIIEEATQVRDLPQFFLWIQGQFQALLPHQVMVCMQFDATGALQQIECVHGSVIDEVALCERRHGLAPRLARHCSATGSFPAHADSADAAGVLAPFCRELQAAGHDNVMLHGSGPVAGGATVFALFGLPMKPGARHAYFLELLLPHLHLALLRLARPQVQGQSSRALSAREGEIIHWLREGKSNYEIACILGLSALTVKNHLQRIYRTLGVSNRTQAVSRSLVRPLQ
jgi:transcriptional regulator EpsA